MINVIENVDEAVQRAKEKELALVIELSKVKAGKSADVSEEINWDEVQDARFFDESGEIHIFRYNGVLRSVESDDQGEICLCEDRRYKMEKRFVNLFGGKDIVVRSYLTRDEDGQMYIRYNRLAGVR